MNFIQLTLFFVFVFSNLVLGIFVMNVLGEKDALSRNRYVFSGEVLLLGSIFIVAELVFLSIVGFYRVKILWAVVLLNNCSLFHKETREELLRLFFEKPKLTLPHGIFLLLMAFFFLRNCYFLVDVDSHQLYLVIQKLWLQHGTSIFSGRGIDSWVYVPAFDTVPFGLGVGLFGSETFFPLLINFLWRLIVLLLVFGYVSFRFDNAYMALAATFLCLFNEHFFTSGANQWVLINGALIAFLFASVYNFWEARRTENPQRFLLGLIFLSQLMANKLQMAYILVILMAIGFLIQKRPLGTIKEILQNRRIGNSSSPAPLHTTPCFSKSQAQLCVRLNPHIISWP